MAAELAPGHVALQAGRLGTPRGRLPRLPRARLVAAAPALEPPGLRARGRAPSARSASRAGTPTPAPARGRARERRFSRGGGGLPRSEVVEFLADYRDLDAFFLPGAQVEAGEGALRGHGRARVGSPWAGPRKPAARASRSPTSTSCGTRSPTPGPRAIPWPRASSPRPSRATARRSRSRSGCRRSAKRAAALLAGLLGARGRLGPRERALPRRARRRPLRRQRPEVLAVLRPGHGLPVAAVPHRAARRAAAAGSRC